MKISLSIHDSDNTVDGHFQSGAGCANIPLAKRKCEDIYKNMVNLDRKDLGLLPPAVRWISDNQRIAVFERPPTVQFVEIAFDKKDNINSSTSVLSFSLPIPWTVYYVLFDDYNNPVTVRVYCRNEPLYSWDDRVYMLPMLNLYYDSTLCNPIFENFEPCETFADGIHAAYNMVWNSGWNLDLSDTVEYSMRTGIPSALSSGTSIKNHLNFFKSWEKLSLLNVLETRWSDPKRNTSGGDFEVETTFKNTLDAFVNDAGQHSGMDIREAMVKIVNSFSVA